MFRNGWLLFRSALMFKLLEIAVAVAPKNEKRDLAIVVRDFAVSR